MTSVAQRLRQKLLDLAIHGKLVPQDPKEETAGELLTRIRKARNATGRARTPAAPLSIPEEEVPFDLPSGWAWCRLGDITLLTESKVPSGEWFDYIDIDAVDNKNNVVANPKHLPVSTAPSRASRGLQSGDTLFSSVRPYLRNIAFIDERLEDCIASTGFHVCRPSEALEPRFLFYVMLSSFVVDGINAHMKGDNSPSVNDKDIVSYPIPLPPLAEQNRIVEKLDEMLKEATRVAEGTERLAQLRKKARAKILYLAIRGKLVKQEKSDEPAAELLKRIAAEKAKLVAEKKIKKEKPLPPIAEDEIPFVLPKGWEWCRLAEIAYVAAGKTPAKTEFVEDGVPYIKMYNLRNQKIDFAFRKQFIKRETHDGKLAKSRLRPGDLLMNIVGPPLGKLAIIPDSISEANFNQAAVMIRPYVEAGIINQYLHYYLWQMDEINSIDTKGTAGQDNISITQSMMMRIALPPLAEQQRIVAKVKEMLAACDAFGGEG